MIWLDLTVKVSRPSGVVTPSGEVETVTSSSPARALLSFWITHATVTFTG